MNKSVNHLPKQVLTMSPVCTGILGITFVSLELSWQLLYAGGGNKISNWINTPKRQKIIDRASGSLFIAAGTLLLFSRK